MPTVLLIVAIEVSGTNLWKTPDVKNCNVVQSVDHVLLHSKGSNLTSNRTIFENKFCKYVPNYLSLSDGDKLQIFLNYKPLWKKVNENEACEAIYAFVKNTYQSAQGLNFCTSVT